MPGLANFLYNAVPAFDESSRLGAAAELLHYRPPTHLTLAAVNTEVQGLLASRTTFALVIYGSFSFAWYNEELATHIFDAAIISQFEIYALNQPLVAEAAPSAAGLRAAAEHAPGAFHSQAPAAA